MTTRILSSLTLACLLPTCLLACARKADDTDTGELGTEESDADTDTDTDTDTDPDYFEPDAMLFDWQAAIRGGELDLDNKIPSYFVVQYVDTANWDQLLSSPTHHCSVLFDLDAAAPSQALVDAGAAYGAWSVPAGSKYSATGECDNMDPAVFGDDPVGELVAMEWGFGLGPASEAFRDRVADELPEYADSYVDGYTLYGGEAMLFNIALAVDENNDPIDVVGASDLPDAFYLGVSMSGHDPQ